MSQKTTDTKTAFAVSLKNELVRELCQAFPNHFTGRKDVVNGLGHRLMDIVHYQSITGVVEQDDFVATMDGGMITDVLWVTGYTSPTGRTLLIHLAPTGTIHSHSWEHVSPSLRTTVMVAGVLPALELDTKTAHLAMRRWRGNRYARYNFEPSNVIGAIRSAIDNDTSVVRTVYEGEVSYAVPVPLYGVYAMCAVSKEQGLLVCSTLLNDYQIHRHRLSGYLPGESQEGAY